MLYGNHHGLSASPLGVQLPPPAPPPLIPGERERTALSGLPPHTLTSLQGLGQTPDEVTAGIAKAIAKGKIKEISVSDTKPTTIQILSFTQFKREFLKAWYGKWWVWAIVGGVAAAGGGTYWYTRRRR